MICCDGAALQFRSRFIFKLLSVVDSTLNLTWCYNKNYHNKGPVDGIAGTLRNCVYRDFMSGKCLTDNPKQFAVYANKSIIGITSIIGILVEEV